MADTFTNDKELALTISDNDRHFMLFEGRAKEFGSIQVILSDGTSTDQLKVEIEATLKENLAYNDAKALADSEWSKANADVLADVNGWKNDAGAFSEIAWFDTVMVPTWWRIFVQRTGGVAGDGTVTIRRLIYDLDE